jgi:hypothetical protein
MSQSYSLFCLGNPLLDIQVTGGEDLLKKYNLNANDAILAEKQHLPMSLHLLYSHAFVISLIYFCFILKNRYDEIVNERKVVYVAGGAAQNAARGAAVRPFSLKPPRLLIHCSMCCPPTPWCMLAASAMTSSQTSSGRRTKGRVSQKPISSRRVSRRERVQ